MKKLMAVVSILVLTVLAGCETDADVASYNLSKEADMFRIQRRVVFYNGITDSYMLTIEGRCSLGNNDSAGQLTVTCKVAEGQFKKHFLGLSDNVTYFVEQLDPVPVSVYRYRVIFKPSTIVPDVELSR
jgi:hypothetical protein